VVKRAVAWVAGIVAVLLLLWAAVHIVISPVNPEQEPPSGHFDSSCWACHFVMGSVEVTEPE
jgi:hypothetical protein